jgi:dihydroorotate dehydrogenase (NAD+) catalytic subunit
LIELAPGHKQGLPVENPVLIAGGMVGYGEAVARGTDFTTLGGVVIGPILASSRAGASLPRLAHTPGGMVLESGLQNRGVANALRRYAILWPKLGCPVVAQLADNDPLSMGKVAARVATAPGIMGLELLPLTREVELAARMVRQVVRASDLPVWVKVPLQEAVAWAEPLLASGANGLTVAQPVQGQLGKEGSGLVSGALFGPLTFALMLPVLRAVARLQLPLALIACGGVHTVAQMEQALEAGASAVQIDSAVWVEPALPNCLVAGWREGERTKQTGASGGQVAAH